MHILHQIRKQQLFHIYIGTTPEYTSNSLLTQRNVKCSFRNEYEMTHIIQCTSTQSMCGPCEPTSRRITFVHRNALHPNFFFLNYSIDTRGRHTQYVLVSHQFANRMNIHRPSKRSEKYYFRKIIFVKSFGSSGFE